MAKTRTRARNGAGTIRKRSDTLWEGRYTDAHGVQRSVYGKSDKEVDKKMKLAQAAVITGDWLEPNKCSVADWLTEWQKDYLSHLKQTSRRTYQWAIDKRIVPAIGNIKLQKLNSVHVRRLLSGMQDEGVSASSRQTVYIVLNSALSAAVHDKIIKDNPMSNVPIPKIPRRKFSIIDREMIPDFIAAAQATNYPDEMIFLLLTGIRSGELRGLQWCDVDLDAGTISINHQLRVESRTKYHFTTPKNDEIRTIHLPNRAIELLKQHKKRTAEDKLKAGADWYDDKRINDLVFRQHSGHPMTENVLFYTARKIGKTIGIEDLSPHDLRHSYAVAALRSGADAKTVQNNLGHASAAMTLDVYAKYTDDMGKVAAQKFNDFLDANT